ncbi:MAG: hypothetical protein NTW56_17205 [Alphaproteobacteria bacterium]|nr:hypothetical protein [Alphaproteobacteria bacterium]
MRLSIALALAAIVSLPAFAQPTEHPAIARLRALLPAPTTLAFDSAAPLAADPDGVRLSGVRLVRPDETVRIAELELEGLTETGVGRAVMRGVLTQDGNDTLLIARIEIERLRHTPAPGGGHPMPLEFGLESLVIEGLEAVGEPRVSIQRVALREYGAGRSGTLSLEGLTVANIPQSPVQGMTLAGFTLAGFDMAALMDAAVRQVPPPSPPAGRLSVAFQQLLLTGPGGMPLGGAAGLLVEADTLANMAGTMRFALRGVQVANSPVTAQFLDALGLRQFDASLTFEAAYEPTAGRVTMPALALGVHEIGAIALGVTLDGWTPAAAQRNDITAMILRDARLRFVDEGLYARALRAQAEQMRMNEEQVRQQHAQLLGQLFSMQNAPPGMLQLRDSLVGLVRRQARGVEVALRPQQPVPVPQIMAAAPQGPGSLIRLLGLTAAPVR